MNNYQSFRLIIGLIACFIMLFRLAPVPTLITFAAILLAFLFFRLYMPHKTAENGRTARREAALRKAKVFLAPYDDIWRDLRLSNSYCYLTLGIDGMTIEGFEKNRNSNAFRTFRVLKSNVHNWEELWNMFCKSFSYNKSYDGLLEDCKRFKLVVEEKLLEKTPEPAPPVKNIPKTDINNCTEKDITALPGVNSIMAKKAVKRREETGGFKSIDEFFALLKLKPHMQEQLRDLIYAGQVPEKKEEKNSSERRVDF